MRGTDRQAKGELEIGISASLEVKENSKHLN
jgi:hypothetical protein